MKLEFELDHQTYSITVDSNISALRVIREMCRRMDIASGCSPQGVCGVCMVLIQGKPRLLCTLRAKNLHRKKIQTLDCTSMKEKADWVARFSACGAAPCGLCTPALVLKAHSVSQFGLTLQQQNKALQMHMCRCMSWCNLKNALTKKMKIGASPYDGAHQLRMLGKMKRVSDFRVSDMIFARPLFAPHASFRIDSIQSEYSYLTAERSVTDSASDICALVYGDQAWYQQDLGTVLGESVPVQAEVRKVSAIGTKTMNESDVVTVDVPFSDSGVLEPESVFVDWKKKKIFISGQSPHISDSSFPVFSLPGASNFGGQATPELVHWAQMLAEKQQTSVLLSLQLSDAFRIRKKRVSQSVEAYVSDKDEYHLKATMGMGREGSSVAQRVWEHSYTRPYVWSNASIECTSVYSQKIATSLQRGLSLEGITAARECALDVRARREGKDPFSIRASLLPNHNAQKLWDCHSMYLQNKRKGTTGLAVASTPLGVGIPKSVQVSIVVRTETCVEIHTGFWDPMIHHLMKEQLKQRTNLRDETISVVCGTEYPCWSGPSIADRDRWLGMSALDDAIDVFLNVVSVMPELALFVGQCFTGTSPFVPKPGSLFGGWSFAVAIALIDDDVVQKVSLCVDIGEEELGKCNWD